MDTLFASEGLLEDQDHSLNGTVVLRSNATQAILLRHYCLGKFFTVTGHQSVAAAHGRVWADADFYWRNIGYIEEPLMTYAVCVDGDDLVKWMNIYRDYRCQCDACFNCIYTKYMIVKLDKSGVIVVANNTCCLALGMKLTEMVGEHITNYVVPQEKNSFGQHIKNLFKKAKMGSGQIQMIGRSGSQKVFHRDFPVTKEGHVTELQVVARSAVA